MCLDESVIVKDNFEFQNFILQAFEFAISLQRQKFDIDLSLSTVVYTHFIFIQCMMCIDKQRAVILYLFHRKFIIRIKLLFSPILNNIYFLYESPYNFIRFCCIHQSMNTKRRSRRWGIYNGLPETYLAATTGTYSNRSLYIHIEIRSLVLLSVLYCCK